MSYKTIFDELEADGVAAIAEMRGAVRLLKKRMVQHSQTHIVQFAKLNALGNIIFQELLEELKQQSHRLLNDE